MDWIVTATIGYKISAQEEKYKQIANPNSLSASRKQYHRRLNDAVNHRLRPTSADSHIPGGSVTSIRSLFTTRLLDYR
ncbi:hypothetical protein L1987_61716 [Smallanthus sonchifolius]|uniref:Uncharacterized protein n=1 Tax=Smallanthus sonchifolius TaxID=185202 RepID=A0ACB9C8I2_9ASTR|nr:hypothetical protein L1987_61716 [Smallanthus sonchifolius]